MQVEAGALGQPCRGVRVLVARPVVMPHADNPSAIDSAAVVRLKPDDDPVTAGLLVRHVYG